MSLSIPHIQSMLYPAIRSDDSLGLDGVLRDRICGYAVRVNSDALTLRFAMSRSYLNLRTIRQPGSDLCNVYLRMCAVATRSDYEELVSSLRDLPLHRTGDFQVISMMSVDLVGEERNVRLLRHEDWSSGSANALESLILQKKISFSGIVIRGNTELTYDSSCDLELRPEYRSDRLLPRMFSWKQASSRPGIPTFLQLTDT